MKRFLNQWISGLAPLALQDFEDLLHDHWVLGELGYLSTIVPRIQASPVENDARVVILAAVETCMQQESYELRGSLQHLTERPLERDLLFFAHFYAMHMAVRAQAAQEIAERHYLAAFRLNHAKNDPSRSAWLASLLEAWARYHHRAERESIAFGYFFEAADRWARSFCACGNAAAEAPLRLAIARRGMTIRQDWQSLFPEENIARCPITQELFKRMELDAEMETVMLGSSPS